MDHERRGPQEGFQGPQNASEMSLPTYSYVSILYEDGQAFEVTLHGDYSLERTERQRGRTDPQQQGSHALEAARARTEVRNIMNYMNQSQVPDGMVANCPWGTPFERWSDRMVERGLNYLYDDLAKGVDSPVLRARLSEVARERGIEV